MSSLENFLWKDVPFNLSVFVSRTSIMLSNQHTVFPLKSVTAMEAISICFPWIGATPPTFPRIGTLENFQTVATLGVTAALRTGANRVWLEGP